MVTIYNYPELKHPGSTFDDLMQEYPNQIFKFPSKNVFSAPNPENALMLDTWLQTVYGILVTPRIMIVPERNYDDYDAVFPIIDPLNHPVDTKYLKPVIPYLNAQKKFVSVIIDWFQALNRTDEGKEFIRLLDESEPLPGILRGNENDDEYTSRTVIRDVNGIDRRINIVFYGPKDERGGNSYLAFARNENKPYINDGRGSAVNIMVDPFTALVMHPKDINLGFTLFCHECIHAYHMLVGQGLPDSYKTEDDMIQKIQYREVGGISKAQRVAIEEIITTGGEDGDKWEDYRLVKEYYSDMATRRKALGESYTNPSAFPPPDGDAIYQFNKKYGMDENYQKWLKESKETFQKKWTEKEFTKMFKLDFRESYLNWIYVKPACTPRVLPVVYTDLNPTMLAQKKTNSMGMQQELTQKQFLENPPKKEL